MLRRRIFSLVLCLGLMTGLLSVSASAAEVKSGVYTASMVTTYYNPDTGNVDDGGTANAALGEGMCRSATDETCLVEVDGDDIWITVRLLLQSNCSNVALYSRSGYDSYSQVSYDIMSEDAANDSIDYRIKVSDVGQKLKCTMYVSPMGRDVLWYLYVGAPLCNNCLEEHCMQTNCRQCDIGEWPNCRYSNVKRQRIQKAREEGTTNA